MNNRIQYTARRPQNADRELLNDFVDKLADAMLQQYEQPLLAGFLKRNAEHFRPYQLKEMLWQLPSLAEDALIGEEKRKNAIKQDLYTYYSENESASVDGLVLFRLKNYRLLLERTAERLVDIYCTKREYDDFVQLLRYFISVQNNRPAVMHLLLEKNGRYALLDGQEKDITSLCLSEFIPAGDFVPDDMDDLLISILITAAPERLVIHGVENIRNHELFTTVGKVFDKTEYCGGCPLCKGQKNIKE